MDGGENEGGGGQARVPFEGNDRVSLEIQKADRSSRNKRKIGDDTHIHNNRFSENEGIGDMLNHRIFYC